ncbi:MAG: NUDIX hydrolase [Elusimicrobiota bacterium]
MKHLSWRTLASRRVFHAPPWITVASERVSLPDGRVVDPFYRVRFPEFVAIVATTADGRIILLRQYRHGVGKVTLAVPTGCIEKHETPLAAAKRELLEETGYTCHRWRRLACLTVDGNRGCGKAHLFVATGARWRKPIDSGDLEEMEAVLLKSARVYSAIEKGHISTLSSVAALLLAAGSVR